MQRGLPVSIHYCTVKPGFKSWETTSRWRLDIPYQKTYIETCSMYMMWLLIEPVIKNHLFWETIIYFPRGSFSSHVPLYMSNAPNLLYAMLPVTNTSVFSSHTCSSYMFIASCIFKTLENFCRLRHGLRHKITNAKCNTRYFRDGKTYNTGSLYTRHVIFKQLVCY